MSSEYIRMRQSIRRKAQSKESAASNYESMSELYKSHVDKDVFIKHLIDDNKESFLWYDYETWGVNPTTDQASQLPLEKM